MARAVTRAMYDSAAPDDYVYGALRIEPDRLSIILTLPPGLFQCR